MPVYDFLCLSCQSIQEKLTRWDVSSIRCESCGKMAVRQLSAPGGIKVNGRMALSQAQKRMIKEPIWEYPDGTVESAH